MAKLTVTLKTDVSAVNAAMDEILSLVESPDCPVKARNRFSNGVVGLFEQGIALDFDQLPASGAGELTIRLLPSDRLRRFVAAFRARHFNA